MSDAARVALAQFGTCALAEAEQVKLDRDTSAACRRAVLALLQGHLRGPLRSLDFIEKMAGGTSTLGSR